MSATVAFAFFLLFAQGFLHIPVQTDQRYTSALESNLHSIAYRAH